MDDSLTPLSPSPTGSSSDSALSRFHWHGGALTRATERFGDPGPEGWLDLSTGIAPVAYPLGQLTPTAWTTLPDEGAVDAFKRVVRAIHGLPMEAGILPVAGEQAALQWMPYCHSPLGGVVPAGSVLVPDPGYGGHGEAWAMAGHSVERRTDPLEGEGRASVIVVINPNNPDGRQWSPPRLLEAARRQAMIGGLLIVDEAFCEVTPTLSLLPHAGTPGLVILRSLGKFFGLPGVRMGWVAGPRALLETLARRMGPWAVSGPALEIGARAEGDVPWRAAQMRRLRRRAGALERILSTAGFTVLGGTDLFKLVEAPPLPEGRESAVWWWEALAARGILSRPFTDQPGWLRFGLPPDRAGEARLSRALDTLGERARNTV
ncbi:MAG: pyridoxal phosphate-dependent class II aminotransferase [Rhodospirillum sp.]|nr:pyridoxal phosphate-dependent class II aminotransferase [Rhodospirillum sp.]MCF8488116.1 pyridoxal phosphate-dependent class II aminotransferase [Rhodospirillum sp.]MCF8501289.1 pyridoxal phosphate-dependent class II aminotransferase [Rhodospirillum sp.]